MRRPVIVLMLLTVGLSKTAEGQTVDAPTEVIRKQLKHSGWAFGAPGGMLLHSAFHGGETTRLAVLKATLREPQLAKHLSLSGPQQQRIETLDPIAAPEQSNDVDPNDQPDEQLRQPDYFQFLDDDQLAKLDRLAFHYDGFAAFNRISLAKRLKLSPATRRRLSKKTKHLRQQYVLPRLRANFAAALPKDVAFRNVDFAARMHLLLNQAALDAFEDSELAAVKRFVLDEAPPREISNILENLAPLPLGVDHLRNTNQWHTQTSTREPQSTWKTS